MPVVLVLLFVGIFIFLAVLSNKKLKQRRATIQSQIDALRGQMQSFVAQGGNLDEKSRERVGLAQESVEAKLQQATGLLNVAVKERHFERIGRILTLVQTKLGNVQSSMGRAQTRADERAQRQADAAARRTGSFGQKGMSGTARQGSFAPPVQVTDANTAWNTIPAAERGACFFCSRPCMLRELTPVVVPIGGMDRRVLACPQDFATVQSGTIPPIRAFSDNGRPVPWYAYNRYDPYDNYYGGGGFIFVNTYPYSAFDSGYWNFNGPQQYDNGQSYNFSPDTPAYQDYASSMAAGDAAGMMGGAGSADFQGMENAADFAGNSDHSMSDDLDMS